MWKASVNAICSRAANRFDASASGRALSAKLIP